MVPGQPIRREFEYKRHGTLCWMGAFDVRRGKPFGFPSSGHDSDTFIELLDVIDTVYPSGRGHIIMDNLSAHDTPDVNEWFDEHPRWTRHFTPKHASWLNQIECWFSILSRHVLARGSFTSTSEARRVCRVVPRDRPAVPLVVPPEVVERSEWEVRTSAERDIEPSPPAPLPKERGAERCRTGLSDGDPNPLEDARRAVEDLTILEAQDAEPSGGEPVVT
jgi:transposase